MTRDSKQIGYLVVLFSFLFSSCDSAGTEATETAERCVESDLISQCPLGTTPSLEANASSSCDRSGSVSLSQGGIFDAPEQEGEVSQLCVGTGSCRVVCTLNDPCPYGIQSISSEELICVPPPMNSCEVGATRCQQDSLESCNLQGQWEEVVCPTGKRCLETEEGAACIGLDETCGDGVVDVGEECDDGNRVTERCDYGEMGCAICNMDCQEVAGETSYCGDGSRSEEEACDGEPGCNEDCQRDFFIQTLDCGHERCPTIEWVVLEGGRFLMGSREGQGAANERPAHMVDLSSFEMMQGEVTVAQYRACVERGACSLPSCDEATSSFNWLSCNYAQNREDYPVNYVNWHQMRTFAEWAGGMLPSEAQWEYAARSMGQEMIYPWGDAEPTCEAINTCHSDPLDAVCTYPIGRSAQGICDLSGNVFEWVLDEYHENYIDAPSDGLARCESRDCSDEAMRRVFRGGYWSYSPTSVRSAYRNYGSPEFNDFDLGARLVRPHRPGAGGDQ